MGSRGVLEGVLFGGIHLWGNRFPVSAQDLQVCMVGRHEAETVRVNWL